MSMSSREFLITNGVALFVLFGYIIMAAFIVFVAVMVGTYVFNYMSSVFHWSVYTVSDSSLKASDFIGYYLQTFLALVIGYLIVKPNRKC
jgi:hypothetical protein